MGRDPGIGIPILNIHTPGQKDNASSYTVWGGSIKNPKLFQVRPAAWLFIIDRDVC